MKCLSCDTVLDDEESVLKYENGEEFIDMCYSCINKSGLKIHFPGSIFKYRNYEEDGNEGIL